MNALELAMMRSPFVAAFDQLPERLPIFPLPGAIVMPGGELPLNIFEPRYLNMVSDSLSTHRMIGMVQPDPTARDGTGLCRTGCAGRITQYRETADGRIEMVLLGVCRYDLGEEFPTTRGYRLIVPDWSRFRDDYADHDHLLRDQQGLLIRTLKRYFEAKQLKVDWNMLEGFPTVGLVNSLGMALPLSEQHKQALLETVDSAERLHIFTEMLDSELRSPGSVTRH
jgi:Lon protease-like protein